jgi:hypothetical protein
MNPVQLYGDYGFIDPFSVSGAHWTAAYVPYHYNLAADNAYYTSLTAYGPIYRGYMTLLDPTIPLHDGEFIFLSYISINFEQATNSTIPTLVNQTSVVYSNGGTEVRFVPLS